MIESDFCGDDKLKGLFFPPDGSLGRLFRLKQLNRDLGVAQLTSIFALRRRMKRIRRGGVGRLGLKLSLEVEEHGFKPRYSCPPDLLNTRQLFTSASDDLAVIYVKYVKWHNKSYIKTWE